MAESSRRRNPLRRARRSARRAPRSARRRRGFVHRREHRPAALRRSRKRVRRSWRGRADSKQRDRRQIEQPRGDHAAAPPDFGDVGQRQVILIMLGVRAWAWFRRQSARAALPALACFRMLKPSAKAAIMPYSMPLCTILTKCPAPEGPQCRYPSSAVPFALSRPGVGANVALAGRERFEDRVEMLHHSRFLRRSSGSSRARVPTRRRWCRCRHNECPSVSVPRRGECRRCSMNCRRRSRCRLLRKQLAELFERMVDHGGRHHQPHGTRRVQFLNEILQEAAPVAPSRGSFLTLPGSCRKRRIRARAHQAPTMLAPIRPRPIIPNCIRFPP